MKKRIVMLFLVGVFVGGMVFVDSAPQAAEAKPKVITWMGQSCLPPGMPVSVGLQDLCDRVKKASGGRLILTAKPAGSVCPATQEWKAIDKGVLDFAATGGSYMVPEVPFGSILSQRVGAKLSPLGHMMWFETEGREMVNKWYKQMGYKFMNIGGFHGLPEGWIHLNKPLKGPEDLKGLKMRASGDGGIVLSRMGVGTVFMPLGEIFEAMKRGIIDAYECSCPSFDYTMKLYEAGKYYYLSPTRAPWEMYEIQVSRSKWEALPEDLKAIFLNCLKGVEITYHALLVADNAKAVQGFKDKGVIVENLPSSIDDAFVPEAVKYLKEVAAKHPSMNEILTSQLKFEEMWKNLYGLPSPGK
ncbi:MAG: TRAP transporter substrate-binding protein DctP [Deltaproteobacteria bacterium]|nr:TRAP transporter substrate-binding protein DctP [Deltaproteobacteria bacterium]